jgi:hypothetical protein
METSQEQKETTQSWVKEMVFNNSQEAEKAVIKQNLWTLQYTNTTVERKKKFFRCHKVKYRGKQVVLPFTYYAVKETKITNFDIEVMNKLK